MGETRRDVVERAPQRDIYVLVHNHRAFPAQFQADGCEVLGGGGGYNAANMTVARVPVTIMYDESKKRG